MKGLEALPLHTAPGPRREAPGRRPRQRPQPPVPPTRFVNKISLLAPPSRSQGGGRRSEDGPRSKSYTRSQGSPLDGLFKGIPALTHSRGSKNGEGKSGPVGLLVPG